MASLEHTTEQSSFDPDQISDLPNHPHPIQSLVLHSCVVRPAKFKGWSVMKQISLTSEDEISLLLEMAPNITDLDLSLRCLMGPDGCDLFKLLMNIPRIELLNLVYHHCKDLPPLVKEKIQLPQRLPTCHLLRNLRALFLSFCLGDADLFPILSCLFNSCPNLYKLLIVHDCNGVMSGIDGAYWEKHQVADCMKHHLSFVDLQSVDLNVQPSLVELVENELRHLQWASSHAVLKFEPYFTA